ncbi:hypothetical protein HS7_17260 [Sulfolobales archaeon HS-7]|nr:hypothetical protein HS7_17260 [Sulfolobales archaeon HS-7]
MDVRPEVIELLIKVLKKVDPTYIKDTLELEFLQEREDKFDTFGRFKSSSGYYEFAISFDKKGNIKRSHVNLISPYKIRDELEKKMYKKE